MVGHVVCLENNPRSIEKYIPVIQRHKLHPEICTRPLALGNFCDDLKKKRQPDLVKAFVLDMHDRAVRDLSEINLPKVSTLNGLAVGFAVAEQYLRKPGSPFQNTPIALLTNYEIPPQIEDRIKKLKKTNHFEILKKPTGLPRFEHFMEEVTNPLEAIKHESSEAAEVVPIRSGDKELILDIREGVDIVIRMLDAIEFSPVETAAAFGYSLQKAADLPAIVRRVKARTDLDISDRIDFIIEIKSKLDALSNDDPGAQRKWLRAKQSFLGNKRPIELIRSGHLDDLVHVFSLLLDTTG
jgi:antitoxin Xre/MbcA/ParS-like protein